MGRRVVSSSRSKNKNRGQGGGRRAAAGGGGTGGGVLTRAKSLALYGVTTTSSSLDLRSRRLDKVVDSTTRHLRVSRRKLPHPPKPTNPSSLSLKVSTPPLPPAAATPGDNAPPPPPTSDANDARATRESTPCNLIRDSSILSAPGSSNKHTSKSTAQQTGGPSCQRVGPSEREINDLFGKPEELQQKNFTEKYNFDPVTEQPLPGRYEWEKLDPPK